MQNILIIAGEASGDQHAAKLVSDIKQLNPNVHFFGVGGKSMQQAGVEVLVDADTIAVVGGIEILRHFAAIRHAWKTVLALMDERKPDLIILVDYPGFNLRMAKVAKRKNIKVVYYISPQVWAWKKRRVNIIRQYVDKMLVILPFEEPFYQKENIPAEFVGHPLADDVHASMSIIEAKQFFNINPNNKIIGLLPGSRKSEIKKLLPTMLQAAELLNKKYNNTTFVLPLAPSLTLEDLEPYLSNNKLDIRIISEHFYDVLQLCEAAIVASGTVTLQVALMGVPLVIIYKLNHLSYFLARMIIDVPFIGLCNIVAEKAVAKELIQYDANPVAIAAEISNLLDDEVYRASVLSELKLVHEKLGKSSQKNQAALAVLTLLES